MGLNLKMNLAEKSPSCKMNYYYFFLFIIDQIAPVKVKIPPVDPPDRTIVSKSITISSSIMLIF